MCDTIVVVRPDEVLFAKSSDRDANEAQLLEQHRAREHAPGARLRCTHIEIPQARRTHAVLLSRPFWMWGAEVGANEHGVVIGNEAVFTDQPYARTGLTGMDLVRLALERGATAAEAVDVIVQLLAAHGQGGGCGYERPSFRYHNSFLVADAREAFVVETADKEHRTEHVTGGVRTISNGLTIPGFREAHRDRLRDHVAACGTRRALTTTSTHAEDASEQSLMQLLRSHGDEAWPHYSPVNGTLGMPCMHGGGLVASSVTTASWVARLSAGGARHWATATSSPCLSLFKPVAVHAPLPDDAAPTGTDDGGASLWWAHEALHRDVMADPARLAPLFAAERDDVEARWLAAPPSTPLAFAEHRRLLGEWRARVGRELAGERSRDVRPAWVRAYWRRRARAAA
jgi:hypothetical protein